MNSNPTSRTVSYLSEGWWLGEIKSSIEPLENRNALANVTVVAWACVYPLVVALSVVYQATWFLVFVAMLLTSEGFFTTILQVTSWARNSGTLYADGALRVIQREFGQNRNPEALVALQSVVREERETLDGSCNRFVPFWRNWPDPRQKPLREFCKSLVEASPATEAPIAVQPATSG